MGTGISTFWPVQNTSFRPFEIVFKLSFIISLNIEQTLEYNFRRNKSARGEGGEKNSKYKHKITDKCIPIYFFYDWHV